MKQDLVRQICLKLANLIVLYYAQQTGTVFMLLPVTDEGRCNEAEAAKTFLNLLLMDMFVVGGTSDTYLTRN